MTEKRKITNPIEEESLISEPASKKQAVTTEEL